LHENLQEFPCATAKAGKKLPVIKKIPAKDFGEAENEMTMRHLFEDIHAEPFSEFHDALLMAGRAEMTAFTREGQQVFMAAVFASDAGKAVFKIAAVQVAVDYFFDIRPPEAILFGKLVNINLHKGFKIILDAVVIIRILRLSGVV
jgi:hypothetical protein